MANNNFIFNNYDFNGFVTFGLSDDICYTYRIVMISVICTNGIDEKWLKLNCSKC